MLLSSLEGAAVTSVKIEGVAHEFTSVPGVREDVIDIILNLKGLICRLHGESGEVEVQVQKEGPGTVKASDIEAPADLEILNPDLVICHLAEGARFEMTLTIARGRGYVAGRGQQGPGDDHRRDPGRLDLLARAARLIRRRRRSRGPAHRLRQAEAGDHDRRLDDAEGRGQGRRRAADQATCRSSPTSTPPTCALPPDGAGTEAAAPSAHGMENILIEELELGVR